MTEMTLDYMVPADPIPEPWQREMISFIRVIYGFIGVIQKLPRLNPCNPDKKSVIPAFNPVLLPHTMHTEQD